MCSYSIARLTFYCENLILQKVLESPLIFILFFKEKKIRKKTLSVTPRKRKNKFIKTESRSKGQVTYQEGMMISRTTPLSPESNFYNQVKVDMTIDWLIYGY